jgi:hypothetical protein
LPTGLIRVPPFGEGNPRALFSCQGASSHTAKILI